MLRADIFITLFTIVYGLMLADLFVSLHRLLRRKDEVRWHWLPLLAAWYLFLVILKNWWDLASLFDETQAVGILRFIAYGHMLALLFLLASAALPGRIPAAGIDLKAFYQGNSRYFWGLMSAVIAVSALMNLIRDAAGGATIALPGLAVIGIFFGLNVFLAVTRRLWVHASLVCLFVLLVGLEIANRCIR